MIGEPSRTSRRDVCENSHYRKLVSPLFLRLKRARIAISARQNRRIQERVEATAKIALTSMVAGVCVVFSLEATTIKC
jgi:hypothetical protein